MFNITPRAISATRVIVAVFSRHILARFLHCTLDSQALHILIGRDLGVDVMPLKNQRQRHRQHKKSNSTHRNQHYYPKCSHILRFNSAKLYFFALFSNIPTMKFRDLISFFYFCTKYYLVACTNTSMEPLPK